MKCGNNTSIWWTSLFLWNMLHLCSVFLPEAGSPQAQHKPGSQHVTRQVCVSNPQDKRNLLCEHQVIMNNHKPRGSSAAHTEIEHKPDKVIPAFSFLYPTSLTCHLKFINFHLLRWKPASKVTSVYWDSCIITLYFSIFLYIFHLPL